VSPVPALAGRDGRRPDPQSGRGHGRGRRPPTRHRLSGRGGRPMTRFRATAVIDKPVEEVFAFAADPENDPRWSSAVSKARRTSKSALGLGSRYEQVLRFVGRRLEVTFEGTGYDPNRTGGIGLFSGPPRSAAGRRT